MNQTSNNRGRLALIGLFALFFAPVLIAYVLRLSPDLLGDLETTNRGQLIKPPIEINKTGLGAASVSNESDSMDGTGLFSYSMTDYATKLVRTTISHCITSTLPPTRTGNTAYCPDNTRHSLARRDRKRQIVGTQNR